MRVVVELDHSSDKSPVSMDSALARQFAQIQNQLMGLLETQSTRDKEFLESLKSQQNTLISAMERIVGSSAGSDSDSLLKAISGMKTEISMPKELIERFDSMEEALAGSMKRSRNRTFGSNY